MKHLRLIAALSVLLPVAFGAARADDVDRYVMQGVDLMYAVRFDDAARAFGQAIAADKGDPRGYFYLANVHLWSYIFDKRQDQLDLFFKLTDQAIAAAEDRIDANAADSRSKLFLGMTYGYKAIANARAENFMAAALSARTCYEKLNDVIRTNPRQYDAYLGLGLFHFLFGSVPKAAQFMAGLGGIKGDAKLGLKEIQTVADHGTYFKNDAGLIIALLDVYYLNDLDKGIGTMEALAKRYPQNVALLYAIGSAYTSKNLPDRAVPFFERVIAQHNDDFKLITDLSLQRCGAAYFTRNDFAKAKPYLQRFLKSSREVAMRAYTWYLLGVCFDIEGNHANALKAYAYVAKSSGSRSPEDRYARRRAGELAATPMSAIDIAILKAWNANGGSRFNEAFALVSGLSSRRDLSPAQRAQIFYALGQAYQGRGEYAKAIDAYHTAISVGKQPETWVTPYSYLHTAECYLKLGDKERWRANIDQAKGMHGYDFEQQLRFEVERDVTLID
jgi:tetratricopeptide (TPR) repeat protein